MLLNTKKNVHMSWNVNSYFSVDFVILNVVIQCWIGNVDGQDLVLETLITGFNI